MPDPKGKNLGLRLGEILVMNGWISWEQLEKALQVQNKSEEGFHSALMHAGSVDKKQGQVLHLGEILIQKEMITWDHLSEALKIQRETGRLIGEILIEKRFVTSKNLHRALAVQFNKSFVDFKKISIAPEAVRLVPRALVIRHKVMPLVQKENILLVAISNPHDINAEKELAAFLPQYEIHSGIACPLEIEQALKQYYPV